jgi:segregation and condensation protein A
MELPTFHLADIDFDGPLTLILQLLARDRIEIRDVKISVILEQYLSYLDQMQNLDLEIAGEFVAMAAHLTYLKARSMLEEEKDISEIEQLIQSLEAMKRRDGYEFIREVSVLFADKLTFDVFAKPAESLPSDNVYRYTIDPAELYYALRAVGVSTTAAPDNKERRLRNAMPAPLIYEVNRKAEEILALAVQKVRFTISDILSECSNKGELVAAFLALLELIREGKLMFGDAGFVLAE